MKKQYTTPTSRIIPLSTASLLTSSPEQYIYMQRGSRQQCIDDEDDVM